MKHFQTFFHMTMIALVVGVLLFSCQVHQMDEPGNLVPKTIDQDSALPRIEIGDVTLHGETMGDISNPIIIFLHGGPGIDYRPFISEYGEENASAYPDQRTITNGGLSRLQDEYFCVFYDQRGAGLSSRSGVEDLTFSDYTNDLDGLIDHFLELKFNQTGISEDKVYLFGWSYGGVLATGYINQYPQKVEKLIFYEPGPISTKMTSYFFDRLTGVFAQIGQRELEDYLHSKDLFSTTSHETSDYQMLLGAFRFQPEFHQNPNTPLWRFGSAIALNTDVDVTLRDSFNITSDLENFQGEMLFIGSDNVLNEFPDYADMFMDYYSNAYLQIIQGTGHTGAWEKAPQLVDITRNFILNGGSNL